MNNYLKRIEDCEALNETLARHQSELANYDVILQVRHSVCYVYTLARHMNEVIFFIHCIEDNHTCARTYNDFASAYAALISQTCCDFAAFYHTTDDEVELQKEIANKLR